MFLQLLKERKNFTTKLPRTTLGTGLARTGTNTGRKKEKREKTDKRGKKERQKTYNPKEGWEDGTPPPATTHVLCLARSSLLVALSPHT